MLLTRGRGSGLACSSKMCEYDLRGGDRASGDAAAPARQTWWGDMERASNMGERGPSMEALSTTESARLGFRKATPMAISTGLFGILYGAACASLGISPHWAALSCILVFSGAVQFAILGMLGDPFSVSTIAVSSLLICNRLFLMGASIADHLRERGWLARLLSMFVLTDGAWAVTTAERSAVDRFFLLCQCGFVDSRTLGLRNRNGGTDCRSP